MAQNPRGSLYARVEVAVRPDLQDPKAGLFLRQVEKAYPDLRSKIRWVRSVQVYWLKMECSREELIFAISEVFLDKTLQWLMTGNLIPSAGGKLGTIEDLLQFSPIRPGKFWGLEKRLRSGAVDAGARSVMEAFEIVLKKKLEHSQISTGEMMILEGKALQAADLEYLAKKIFVNEQLETWTIQEEDELIKNNRFHQERIHYDFPKVFVNPMSFLRKTDPVQLKTLFQLPRPQNRNGGWYKKRGLELLLEWSEDWMLSVSTENQPDWLNIDVQGGSYRTVLQSVLNAACSGFGAKPIALLTGMGVAENKVLGKGEWAPSVVVDQLYRGVAFSGHQQGVPLVTAEVCRDDTFSVPTFFSTAIARTPIKSFEKTAYIKEVKPGDRLWILGGPTLKDKGTGVLSATHRSDGLMMKRMVDLIIEARDLGFFRTLIPVGASGLGKALAQASLISNGLQVNLSVIPIGTSGMGWEELFSSACPERILFVVPVMHSRSFEELCRSRMLSGTWIGEFTQTNSIELRSDKGESYIWSFADLLTDPPETSPLEMGVVSAPSGPSKAVNWSFEMPKMNDRTAEFIYQLMRSKNIMSRQDWYRHWDREVQGTSVIQSLWGKVTEISGFVYQLSSAQIEGFSGAAVLVPEVEDDYDIERALDWLIARCLSLGGEFGNPDSRFIIQSAIQGDVGFATYVNQSLRRWSDRRNVALDCVEPANPKFLGRTVFLSAISRMLDVKMARSPDFKNAGDIVYIVGGLHLGLVRSEYEKLNFPMPVSASRGEPDWDTGLKTYSWLGGALGRSQLRIKSCQPVQAGGVVTALSKSLVGRDLGVQIDIPDDREPWTFCFGEGLHTLIITFSESDSKLAENEWMDLNIPFYRLGTVTSAQKLRVNSSVEHGFIVPMDKIRESFLQQGAWI